MTHDPNRPIHDPNRPTGSVPPERDRTMGGATPPPEHRGPNRGDGGNSAMALIVGALAVALIIGAFFWFAGDTQDTATLDDPAVTEEEMGTTEEPMIDEDTTLDTTEEEVIEEDTDVTVVEPTEEETVIDETQQDTTGQTQTQDEEVIDETQQQ
jgi:cytoskeletal protein RodZ